MFCVQRAGKIFNKSVRDAMGDYGVTIAILAFTGVAFAFKRHGDTAVPTLAIPSEFAPTWVNPETGKARSWFVYFYHRMDNWTDVVFYSQVRESSRDQQRLSAVGRFRHHGPRARAHIPRIHGPEPDVHLDQP